MDKAARNHFCDVQSFEMCHFDQFYILVIQNHCVIQNYYIIIKYTPQVHKHRARFVRAQIRHRCWQTPRFRPCHAAMMKNARRLSSCSSTAPPKNDTIANFPLSKNFYNLSQLEIKVISLNTIPFPNTILRIFYDYLTTNNLRWNEQI